MQWIFDLSESNVLAIAVAYCEFSLKAIDFWPKSALLSRVLQLLLSFIANILLKVIPLISTIHCTIQQTSALSEKKLAPTKLNAYILTDRRGHFGANKERHEHAGGPVAGFMQRA